MADPPTMGAGGDHTSEMHPQQEPVVRIVDLRDNRRLPVCLLRGHAPYCPADPAFERLARVLQVAWWELLLPLFGDLPSNRHQKVCSQSSPAHASHVDMRPDASRRRQLPSASSREARKREVLPQCHLKMYQKVEICLFHIRRPSAKGELRHGRRAITGA